ncbi:uncharacterized protein LOC144471740 [Augochlora pura]
MKKIQPCIVLFAFAFHVTLIFGDYNKDSPYCFKFTWVAAAYNRLSDEFDCMDHEGLPCIYPPYIQDKYPNTSEIWEARNTNDSSLCRLTSGDVCLKHTVTFNNEMVNATVFCGKVVEDAITSITSGCYKQKKDGHTIELCACQSRKGAMPCNASNAISSNFFSLVILLFTLAYINC